MQTILLKSALLTAMILLLTPALPAQDPVTTAPMASDSETTSAEASSASAKPSDEINTATLDQQLISELIIRYTNDERTKADLQPLRQDEPLHRLAEKHSRDMAARGYFSHTSQREDRPDIPFEERVSLQKLGYQRTGENIALQPIVLGRQIITRTAPSGEVSRDVNRNVATYGELARQTVTGWMNSKGHRENILTAEFNLIGIGIGVGQREGTPYAWITQNFGQK